jgi:hypothetical protein
MNNRGSVRVVLLEGMIALAIALIAATFTYYLGKSKGTTESKTAFDQIATQVNLNNTKWEVSYEDAPVPDPKQSEAPASKRRGPGNEATPQASPSPIKVATLEFTQAGSRILGVGRDLSGRRWIIEGAAAERRVCYIYYDPDGQRLSMGTVLLALDNSGTQMVGEWLGWSPESNALQPRKVTLRKLSN